MLTLRQLKYFVSVAEQGSIKGAAEALFISQPGISAAITQLESILGVQLLIRQKSKGVELTAAGQLVLKKSRSLLQSAHDFSQMGKEFSQSMKGPITIGIFHSLGSYVLPRLLAAIKKKYPETELSIFEGDQKEIQDALKNGTIEIALIYDIGLDKEMEFQTLKTLHPYLILSGNSPFAQKKNLTLNDLKDEPLVLLDLPYSREYFYSIFQRAGFMPKIGYKTKSVPMLRSLIANNLGYSILNYTPEDGPDYKGKSLIHVNINDIDHSLNLVVSWRTNTQLSMKAESLISMIEEYFAS